jgi:2-methylcitrate dehydratase PrpD
MLNELWDPAYKLRQNIEKDPGELKPEDGQLVEKLLNKHAEGRTVDLSTGEDVNKKLDQYASRDPRVKDIRDKIDETLNGQYKDAYKDYQTKYIPFADAQSLEKAKASGMLDMVRARVLDATGVPENRRQDLVSMLKQTIDEERHVLRF